MWRQPTRCRVEPVRLATGRAGLRDLGRLASHGCWPPHRECRVRKGTGVTAASATRTYIFLPHVDGARTVLFLSVAPGTPLPLSRTLFGDAERIRRNGYGRTGRGRKLARSRPPLRTPEARSVVSERQVRAGLTLAPPPQPLVRSRLLRGEFGPSVSALAAASGGQLGRAAGDWHAVGCASRDRCSRPCLSALSTLAKTSGNRQKQVALLSE